MEELHDRIAAHLRGQRPATPARRPAAPMPREEREVAIYARAATMTQGNRAALEAQIAACRAYAAERGDLALAIYQEVMGGDTLERPRLAELRTAIAHGWIAVVLVTTLDRLTRDPALLGALRAEWGALGVAIIAVME